MAIWCAVFFIASAFLATGTPNWTSGTWARSSARNGPAFLTLGAAGSRSFSGVFGSMVNGKRCGAGIIIPTPENPFGPEPIAGWVAPGPEMTATGGVSVGGTTSTAPGGGKDGAGCGTS